METKKIGGELTSFVVNGKERIHQGEECLDKGGKPYWNRHAPVLFPMVGKLKNNQTKIDNNIYEMGQHGFARDSEFMLVKETENKHIYKLKSTEETLKKYPFAFSLQISYEQMQNKIKTTYQIKNEGDKSMPFGIGGHPAFRIDLTDLEKGNYFLEWEEEETKAEFWKLEEGLICEEKARNPLKNKKILELDNHTFDEDAIVMTNLSSHKVTLKNKRTEKAELEMDFSEFPYLGIWSKPGAPFICIEPWQSTADFTNTTGEFEKKEGIKTLQPGEEFECSYEVTFF